jgi:hypothetical protein
MSTNAVTVRPATSQQAGQTPTATRRRSAWAAATLGRRPSELALRQPPLSAGARGWPLILPKLLRTTTQYGPNSIEYYSYSQRFSLVCLRSNCTAKIPA